MNPRTVYRTTDEAVVHSDGVGKTLAQITGIGERELARILHVCDFSFSDRDRLRQASVKLQSHLPELVEKFYELQLSDVEIAAIIGDTDTLARVKSATAYYMASLFECIHDSAYVASRLRIGKVHYSLGVAPHIYMRGHAAMHGVLESALRRYCVDTGAAEAEFLETLRKAMLVDCHLIFESYITAHILQIEQVKSEVDRFASTLGVRFDAAQTRLHTMASRDPLTGLLNRRAMEDFISHEIAISERYKLPLSLLFIDLNGFKAINDSHGHSAGDRILCSLGQALVESTRGVDLAGRWGGDEFCVLLPRTDTRQALVVTRRILSHFNAMTQGIEISVSAGLVELTPPSIISAEELVHQRDQLMYRAKSFARDVPGHHVCAQHLGHLCICRKS